MRWDLIEHGLPACRRREKQILALRYGMTNEGSCGMTNKGSYGMTNKGGYGMTNEGGCGMTNEGGCELSVDLSRS